MSRLKVLIAGDKMTSELLSEQLSAYYIDVVGVETAAQALERVHREYFDAHILESRFPDGNGFDLCTALQRCSPDTPNAFFSGDVQAGDRERGLTAGAVAYLTKPYEGDMAAFVLQLVKEGRRSIADLSPSKNPNRMMHRPSAII